MSRDLIDGAVGALLGTMVGDALGMPAEGMTPAELQEAFGHLDSLREGRLPAGEYTDDTEMCANVAEALLEAGGFDLHRVAHHLAHNFTPWRGYSPHIYGIMARIRQGLSWESPNTQSWDTGAAVRAAPLGVLFVDDLQVVEHAAAQAEITHTHPNGVAGAVAHALAVSVAMVQGLFESAVDRRDLLRRLANPVGEHSVALTDALERIRDLRPQSTPAALSSAIARVFQCDGSAVGSIPAALAAFLLTESFEDAVLAAVNCGGQSDTLGAMTGALAGAFYGANAIPERLTAGLANEEHGRDYIVALGERLGKLTRKQRGARLESL